MSDRRIEVACHPDDIRPLTEDELHQIACEVDHAIKNVPDALDVVWWNNRAVAMLLDTIGQRTKKESP